MFGYDKRQRPSEILRLNLNPDRDLGGLWRDNPLLLQLLKRAQQRRKLRSAPAGGGAIGERGAAEVGGFDRGRGKRVVDGDDATLGGKKRRVGWGAGGEKGRRRGGSGWKQGRYYHSKSCMPMTQAEWGRDSDDEYDEELCQVRRGGRGMAGG
jgi:hypothetical protein